MSDHDIYRQQQFGKPTGLGKAPALLVIDFVNGFADPAHSAAATSPRRSSAPCRCSPLRARAAGRSPQPHRLCRRRLGHQHLLAQGAAAC